MLKPIVVQRSNFEDHPAQDGISENHHVSLPARGIFVVADGLGGPVFGKNAARAACEGVVEFLTREAGDRDATLPFVLRNYYTLAGNILFNSIIHANRKLLELNRDRGVHERGAASVIAGYVDRDVLALASVGSVAAWMGRAGEFGELVRPRSWGRMLEPLRIYSEGPGSRLPLMALGVGDDLEPEITEVRLRPGDQLWAGTGEPPGYIKSQYFQMVESDLTRAEVVSLNWTFGS